MSNTPTIAATFPAPRQRTPLPPKTYATYNDALENLRYQCAVLRNLAADYWRDYQQERATIRDIAAALRERGYSFGRGGLRGSAARTPQIVALMSQLLTCQLMVRQSLRGWREARRVGVPLEGQLRWEEGEEAAERERQRFAVAEGGRVAAERRRGRGKGREVVVVEQRPGRGGRVGEASSSRG